MLSYTLDAKIFVAKIPIAKIPIAKISVEKGLTLRFPAKKIVAKISVAEPVYHFLIIIWSYPGTHYIENSRNIEMGKIVCVVELKSGYNGVITY